MRTSGRWKIVGRSGVRKRGGQPAKAQSAIVRRLNIVGQLCTEGTQACVKQERGSSITNGLMPGSSAIATHINTYNERVKPATPSIVRVFLCKVRMCKHLPENWGRKRKDILGGGILVAAELTSQIHEFVSHVECWRRNRASDRSLWGGQRTASLSAIRFGNPRERLSDIVDRSCAEGTPVVKPLTARACIRKLNSD